MTGPRRDEAIPAVSCKAPNRPIFISLFILATLLAGCAPSIHDTVARRDADTLRAMLDADPALVMARNNLGKTPLHYAVTYAATDMIPLLIEKGADVNAPDNTGLTPLHVAAMLDRTKEAEALIAQGANIDAKDNFGDTPLHTAALFGQPGMAELLIKAGADTTARNNNQLTPVECALQNRKTEVVELLNKRPRP